ncbi:proton-dependent oligopeptide transporter, POT family [Stigmatella aurantiaca]|uniref:Proton-dependent oligopeptide transporter, POT family n=1 Tax=Stigmatella aurantiaca TaxID=41 RepID=A0A1H7UJ95_STIAU|nr:peptide MFS transporter [Stigmatella aurantiaca]SEL96377.1 proton-dependent oligopeptide transporter, POT family [Stigmatella aurantiaca]
MSTSTAQQLPLEPPSSDGAAPAAPKGHPKGLYVLFATEMWERFSYYGMRALLVLYLLNYLQFQPADSSSVFKWYTSLVYLTPLLGGFLADRYLGLRASIIMGAVLMAIGHFLMAFEPLPLFYAALAFLIAGNGFFKPNISTLVGKLYKQGDARRDGAFTIFYMGINIGAFLSPLICGWLRRNMGPTPGMGYHWGFAAAGVGMVLSLIIFLVGQKQVLRDVAAAGNLDEIAPKKKDATVAQAAAEEPDEQVPSTGGFGGLIAKVFPWLLFALAVVVPVRFITQAVAGHEPWTNVIMPTVFSAIGAWMGWTLLTIKNAARDKSTVIFVLFTFVVLFWMAFEQAGNALNIWAAYNTATLDFGLFAVEGEDYQAANALFIVAFAPLFAMMWTGLARRGLEISTAAKMLAAMVLITASFGAMVAGAAAENATVTRVPLASLPPGVQLETLNAGRFGYEPGTQELTVRGVLAPFAVTNALRPTVDKTYMGQVEALEAAARNASPERPTTFQFTDLPQGYTFPLQGGAVSAWDASSRTVTMVAGLSPLTKAQLVGAGAPPAWREAITSLAEKSKAAQVSGFWLLLSYLLATFGELCLSPVGLSMVTKLAPTRFASLFMGVWLLSSAVAQYVGGSLGEKWGEIVPTSYFAIFVYSSLVGAVVLLILQAPLKRLMHSVR